MRFKLTIEFDGGPFVGWQRQRNGRSVQQVLEEAVLAFAGEAAVINGAGRTDAGVHALGQVAHLDLVRDWPAETVRDALNAFMKSEPVVVLSADQVGDDFDARTSATARHYRYRILNRRPPPAVERGQAWWVAVPLDHAAMHQAGQALVGKHDFTTFRAAACQARSPLRTLDRLAVTRAGDEVVIEVSARSFLHHQVRSFAGSLKLVGEGSWPIVAVGEALVARDRKRCGPVAPAEGLYLVAVDY